MSNTVDIKQSTVTPTVSEEVQYSVHLPEIASNPPTPIVSPIAASPDASPGVTPPPLAVAAIDSGGSKFPYYVVQLVGVSVFAWGLTPMNSVRQRALRKPAGPTKRKSSMVGHSLYA